MRSPLRMAIIAHNLKGCGVGATIRAVEGLFVQAHPCSLTFGAMAPSEGERNSFGAARTIYISSLQREITIYQSTPLASGSHWRPAN